jgi:hypothetical protein
MAPIWINALGAACAGGGNELVNLLAGSFVGFMLMVFFFRRRRLGHLFFRLSCLWLGGHLKRGGPCRGRSLRCGRGRFRRRRRSRFFFFRDVCIRAQFAFRAEPATITYDKLWLFFSHTSSVSLDFER